MDKSGDCERCGTTYAEDICEYDEGTAEYVCPKCKDQPDSQPIEAKQTAEPLQCHVMKWKDEKGRDILAIATEKGRFLGSMLADTPEGEANARHVVACWNVCRTVNLEAAPKLLAACIDAELYIARGQGAPKVVICTLLDAIASAQPQN